MKSLKYLLLISCMLKCSCGFSQDQITAHKDTVPKVIIPVGTIQVTSEQLPVVNHHIYLLTASDVNDQDMKPFAPRLKWKGLFITKISAYIKNAKLHFAREHSELDEEGQTTGWRITSDDEDYGYFISGAKLINGPVKRVINIKDTVAPGDKQVFKYNNVIYTIYATGYYNAKNNEVTNYKLYLLAKVKGHSFNQLLFSTTNLRDEKNLDGGEHIRIVFAGDIDGDGIPDFIIESDGINFGNDTLYVSKPAGNSAILKEAAIFGSSD